MDIDGEMEKLFLEEVDCSYIHKKLLFDIFQQKKTEERISSSIDLHFEAHCSFVDKHPYRYWFLVKVSKNYIGTLYITNENSIGVQLLECYQIYFETLINQVLEKYKPLTAIPSVRPSDFIINISPSNTQLESKLHKMGADCVQKTFKLVKNENT
jgi:hypothetical protein